MNLQTCRDVLQIYWNVCIDAVIPNVSNRRDIVIETGVIGSKCIVLGAALRYDDNIEIRRSVGDCSVGYILEGWPEEPECPIDLTILDTRLASCPQYRLRP